MTDTIPDNQASKRGSVERRARSGGAVRQVEKAAAAIEGAIEGAAEAMDQYHLPEATHRAINQGDRLVGSVSRRPNRPSRMAKKLHEMTGKAQAQIHHAQEDVVQKAHAVAETTKRAAAVPGQLTRDLGKALDAWVSGMAASAGWMLATAVTGTFCLVLLTMALVAGLTAYIGATWALLAVGGIYLVAALTCLSAGKAVRAKASQEAHQHVEEAREDLRRVTEPMRQAFGDEPGPYHHS